LEGLKSEYEHKIVTSPIRYDHRAGDFSFGDTSIYFWQSLLKTKDLRTDFLNNIINSRILMACIFTSTLIKRKFFINDKIGKKQFINIVNINYLSYYLLVILSPIFIILNCINFSYIILNKLFVNINIFYRNVKFISYWKIDKYMSIAKASSISRKLIGFL